MRALLTDDASGRNKLTAWQRATLKALERHLSGGGKLDSGHCEKIRRIAESVRREND